MKKILFLDDNPNRHYRFKQTIKEYDAAYTAEDAIELLKKNTYGRIFLDHDLGGLEYVDSNGEEPTGYTVAKWIVQNLPNIKAITIHSHNPAGAANMLSLLKSAGYVVEEAPFHFLMPMLEKIAAHGEEYDPV